MNTKEKLEPGRQLTAYERLQFAHAARLFNDVRALIESVGLHDMDGCENVSELHSEMCAWLATNGHQRMPVKVEIPPAPADPLDVVRVEGWNQCCDAFFGGAPTAPPLIIETIKETVPVTLVQAIHEFVNEVTYARCGHRFWRHTHGDAEIQVQRLLTALEAAS